MRLLLIRHAQTPSNADGLIDTAPPGPELTTLGLEQAEALVSRLAGERIDGIFVSGLRRTVQTAAPLAGATGLDVLHLPGLAEVRAGVYEGRGDQEAIDAYVGMLIAWYGGDFGASVPDEDGAAVDGRAFLERYDTAIAEVVALRGAGTSVVVSHGAAIRAWTAARARNAGDFGEAIRVLENTGLAELVLEDDGWRLLRWEGRPGAPVLADRNGTTS